MSRKVSEIAFTNFDVHFKGYNTIGHISNTNFKSKAKSKGAVQFITCY